MTRIFLFFRLFAWFGARNLKARPVRALIVLLGIGLGSAVFTSVRLSAHASLDSFNRSMDEIAGTADFCVARPGGRVPETIVPLLLKNPYVLSVAPALSAYVTLKGEEDRPFLLLGVDPLADRSFRSWKSEGRAPSGGAWLDLMAKPYSILVGRGAAQAYGLVPGGAIALQHVGEVLRFRIVDLLEPTGLASVEGGFIGITDIATMQEFTGLIGLLDRIDIKLSPHAPPGAIGELEKSLPDGVVIERPSESKESGLLMIRAYHMNLSVLSFVSLFVGMFLVYSLIALHAASRRRELAILRSLGAGPRTLFALFLCEGALFGVAGWALAIPLSSLLVKKLLTQIGATISALFVRIQVGDLTLNPWEIAISFGVTVLVALAAAFHPARQALKVAPREAMAIREGGFAGKRSAPVLAGVGAVLIAAVWPISNAPCPVGFAVSGYISAFLLFCGFSLLAPLALFLMGSFLPPALRRLGGVPAFLAGRYTRDAGTGAAISVGALITAMALFVGLVIMVHSFRSSLELWVSQTVSGDIFLRPRMAGINRYRDPFPPEVVQYLSALGDRAVVVPYRRIYLRDQDKLFQLDAVDFEKTLPRARYFFLDGDNPKLEEELIRGDGVIVSEVYANQMKKKVGDRFQATIEGTAFDLPILGIFRDYRTQGGVVEYSFPRFQRATGDFSWGGARIFLPSGEPNPEQAALRLKNRILKDLGGAYAVQVTSGHDLRREILRIFDETFAVTTALLVIALFVASLGIATTMSVLVLERELQLNILTSIGAGYGQIRRMIFWEALLLVAAGEVIGYACGFALSYLLVTTVNRQSFGWTFLYSINWPSLVAAIPLILLAALAAALPATRLILRLDPALALKER